jgi:hypothetical protein
MSLLFHKQHINSFGITGGLLAFALGVCIPAQSEARPDLRMEYDLNSFVSDNPFLIAGKKRGSAAAEILVRPSVDWRLTPRSSLEFTGEAGFRQYHRRYGNFVTGVADLRLQHRHNEYLSVSSRGGFGRYLVTDTLTEIPDFTRDTRGTREIVHAGAATTWTPNRRFTVIGDIGWNKQRYPDSSALETSKALDFSLSASRRMSESTTLGIQGRITSNSRIGGEDSSVKSLNLTASRRFSEYWRGDVQLGAEWAKTDASLVQTGETRTNFNGSANLCHESPRTTVCVRSALRSEVNDLGELQREVSAGSSIRHRTSESGSILAEANYRRARMPRFADPARYIRASANYERRFAHNLYLTPGIAYLERSRLPGEKVSTFIFQIGLSIRGERR